MRESVHVFMCMRRIQHIYKICMPLLSVMPHFDILDVGQVYISNAYKIVQIHN